MAATLAHRGPDDGHVEILGNVGLGHRRLSILDLSAAGRQPMSNEDGTVWLVYNGEVYNFQQLRDGLAGRHTFRSGTDSEVLLHLYEERGEAMVDDLDGMFAFGLVDLRRRRLLLARDPFGIKPLFYSLDRDRLVFGSEIKPLLASGEVSRDLDPAALNDFFDFHWIPAPRSIFKAVRKLPPAHTLRLDLATWEVEERRYWTPRYAPEAGRSLASWAEEVEHALEGIVRRQMVADVPVGVFLSGGIDSTLIARAASRAGGGPPRTFTIDFEEAGSSEAAAAREVAERIGAQAAYRTVRCDAVEELGHLAQFYDEPFADSSLLPTVAVCRAARQSVTVALSGDGADEIFGGYHHHRLARAVGRMDAIPHLVTRLLFGPLAAAAPAGTRVHDWARRLALPDAQRSLSLVRLPGREPRLGLLAPDLRQEQEERFWHMRENVAEVEGAPAAIRAQLNDLQFYLPNDMLVKVDRASMSCSLEVRVPFLTRSLCDLAFRIPDEVRFRFGESKRVLRHLVSARFSREIACRPKKGFSIPLLAWMRSEAVASRRGALLRSPAVTGGVLDGRAVARLFDDVRGWRPGLRTERSDELFALLVFDAWHGRYEA